MVPVQVYVYYHDSGLAEVNANPCYRLVGQHVSTENELCHTGQSKLDICESFFQWYNNYETNPLAFTASQHWLRMTFNCPRTSMGTGDVIVVDGTVFRCEMFGFQQMTLFEEHTFVTMIK